MSHVGFSSSHNADLMNERDSPKPFVARAEIDGCVTIGATESDKCQKREHRQAVILVCIELSLTLTLNKVKHYEIHRVPKICSWNLFSKMCNGLLLT